MKHLTRMNTATAVANKSQDPFEQLANAMAQAGKPLKCLKGRWLSGHGNEERSEDGVKLIADVPGLMMGWRKWTDKKIVSTAIGSVADNYRPPQRNELDDLDDAQWERDHNGQPKDPWSFGFYLRLIGLDGEEYVYSAISNGARRAVCDLVKEFTRRRKKDPVHCFPLVQLATDFYKHKIYGRIDVPKLQVVEWRAPPDNAANTFLDGPTDPFNGSTLDNKQLPALDGSDDADLNDEVPF
jgi:hypothetical protein